MELSVFTPESKIQHAELSEGLLMLVDKPYDWSSFDVIRKVKKYIKPYRIGHAGTLDPFATGLLLLAIGKYTKHTEMLQQHDKEYTGSIYLGATTESYDKEHEPNEVFSITHINEESILKKAKDFEGEQLQYPPIHSAIKQDGKRLFQMARAGEVVKVQPRTVTIKDFEITKIELPLVHFRVVCSKGTYIRSLAHDFGKALGAGAYLNSLCRTRSGDFNIQQAWQLSELLIALHEIKGSPVSQHGKQSSPE